MDHPLRQRAAKRLQHTNHRYLPCLVTGAVYYRGYYRSLSNRIFTRTSRVVTESTRLRATASSCVSVYLANYA
jgi:hypothetical protein